MSKPLGSSGTGFVIVFSIALLLPLAFVQRGCEARGGREIGPDHMVPRVHVFWTSEKVTIEYRIQNTTLEAVEFEFRDSGRVCGVIRDPQGVEIYPFPQITAPVLGTETLAPGEDRAFRHEVLVPTLGALPPDTYPVEAWLCGYRQLRAAAAFEIPGEE
ncbi:MAG: BsuPI-related putative proteinase inhibitor [Candidatus Acidoferrales bacterium]